MASEQVPIKERIVEKLARQHAYGANSVNKDTIEAYFPVHEQGAVDSALKELIRDSDSPVTTASNRKEIKLTNRPEALDYLMKSGGRDADFRLYYQLIHQSDAGGLTDDSATESDTLEELEEEDLDEETKYIVDELKRDNKESREAAESWRKEARRRQRLSLVIGVVGLILGAILRHIAPLFF